MGHTRVDNWNPIRRQCWACGIVAMVQVFKRLRKLRVMVQHLHYVREETDLAGSQTILFAEVLPNFRISSTLSGPRMDISKRLFAEK